VSGNQTAVVIVGAGPVALTLALGPARHGTPCRVLDASPGPGAISRATEIHARAREIFDAMGIAGDFLDGGPLAEVPFSSHGRLVAGIGREAGRALGSAAQDRRRATGCRTRDR
jgi:2-polyprenyl-6-methoxyphenol hydroxylase-like FAD-dependent oxidoreductase